MVFIETPIFSRLLSGILSDDEYTELQQYILDKPDIGSIIRNSGGIRKMRWGFGGRGKSGGIRIIYYWRVSADQIIMLYLYPKNKQDDLTDSQLSLLRESVKDIPDG